MKYKRFGNTVVVRMDKGEEIVEQVKQVALKENIKLAQVSALGATDDFEVGLFDTQKMQYLPNHFTGDHEIVSLTGTINTMNGEYYSHLHMSAAGKDGSVVGGHLKRAVISVTCEMVITLIDGVVDREFVAELGLNQFKF